MSRALVVIGALLAFGWSACHHMAKPTPYSGSPSFPNMSPQNNQGGAPPADAGTDGEAAPQNSLIGVWRANEKSLDIRNDGILLINGQPFKYAIGGQTLFVEGPDGAAASYPFELSGDQLVVTVNGQRVTYSRTSPSPAPGAAPGGAPSSGATPAELVGKWCHMANVNATNGGRQTNTCFSLNADGSYQYHSESSSSGTVSGNAWGTASQSDDRGRWSAAGNTLTAQSSSGKVANHAFEKRNHPKTNDPMLVIGGEAFVTYYQKAPW